jgi:hypothetical protein
LHGRYRFLPQYDWHISCIANATAIRRHQAEFHDMPMRGELPRAVTRPYPHASRLEIAWFRCRAILFDRNLQSVVAFCVIGFLLAANIILRFPDFGAYYDSLPISP